MTNTPASGSYEKVRVSSWEGLQGLGDFSILQLDYVPSGLHLVDLGFHYHPNGQKPPTKRNGIVIAFYVTEEEEGERGFLSFFHGWGMGFPRGQTFPTAKSYGLVGAGKYEATWIRGQEPGGVGPRVSTKPDDVYLRLGWNDSEDGSAAPGWRLATDCVSLDELRAIVVSFRTL